MTIMCELVCVSSFDFGLLGPGFLRNRVGRVRISVAAKNEVGAASGKALR